MTDQLKPFFEITLTIRGSEEARAFLAKYLKLEVKKAGSEADQ